MTATTGTVGTAISPAPTATCNGSTVTTGLAWTPANYTPSTSGNVSVSVSASSGVCSGMTAQCGNVTVSPTFACTMTATTGTIGTAISPAPTATCNGSSITSGLTWTPANRTPTTAGSIPISVSTSSGVCSGMTAQCGSVTVPERTCTISAVSNGSMTCGGQTYRTVVIGTQTWMAENLNYNPGSGSACYNNQTSNCVTYGRLYNWATAMNLPSSCNSNSCSNQIQSPHRGICPVGWHIPSSEDWGKLSRYVDGTSGTFAGYSSPTAARYLKATSGWNNWNGVSSNGTDDYGFSALPGGRVYSDGSFYNVGDGGYWWSASEHDGASDVIFMAYSRDISIGYDSEFRGIDDKTNLQSVRCLQDGYEESSSSSFVHSGKGNDISNYRTVVIGTQTWMAENLDYTVAGSKCNDNDPANCDKYGQLYNWATVMDLPSSCNESSCSSQIQSPHRGICPSGWHIPSVYDWNVLKDQVGGWEEAGKYLKATSGWAENGNGTDDYGFSALPGGRGYSDGSFSDVGYEGQWWSTVFIQGMWYGNGGASWFHFNEYSLYSVRCLQD